MAIPIQNHKLTPDQYLKLFSNPVSGIACDMNGAGTNYDYAHMGRFHLKNIRYSKSMILKALYFWEKQYDRYLELLKKAQFNPLFKSNYDPYKENEILKLIMMVHNFPDTFLFSHRHIDSGWGTKDSQGMIRQHQLLSNKYPELFKISRFTGHTDKKELCTYIETIIGIKFTVFPNEHPYIPRQKISRVGMTEKGNVYIMMDNGAQKK